MGRWIMDVERKRMVVVGSQCSNVVHVTLRRRSGKCDSLIEGSRACRLKPSTHHTLTHQTARHRLEALSNIDLVSLPKNELHHHPGS